MSNVTSSKRLTNTELEARLIEEIRKREKLEQRIAALEKPVPEAAPEPAPRYPDNLPRNGRGEIVSAETEAEYRARKAQEFRHRELAVAEQKRLRTEGLPPGYFRDWSGLVRDASGKLASLGEREEEAHREVMQRQAEEHRRTVVEPVRRMEEQLRDSEGEE